MDTDEISVYLIPIPCLLLVQCHTTLTPLQSVFFLNMFLVEPCGMRMRDIISPTGIKPMPPALET